MLYLDHKKSHNHNPLSFNKILNPKEKQSQEYAPYRLIRGFSFRKSCEVFMQFMQSLFLITGIPSY